MMATTWTNCQGSLTWADGNKYVGEFRDGKRNGQGTYIFASGNRYVGKFRNNMRHGEGTYMLANGTPIREGVWKSDRFVGGKVRQPESLPPSGLNLAVKKCGDLGLKTGTEKFGECVLKLSR